MRKRNDLKAVDYFERLSGFSPSIYAIK